MKINFVKGDAISPQGEGNKIICHICNDKGAWGAGFVLAITKLWGYPEQHYRRRNSYPLGHADVLSVSGDDDGNVTYVANMIAQHNVRPDSKGIPPIRYAALAEALATVNADALKKNATLHMPRIGCGLAGGDWDTVQDIILKTVTVDVTVYDLP